MAYRLQSDLDYHPALRSDSWFQTLIPTLFRIPIRLWLTQSIRTRLSLSTQLPLKLNLRSDRRVCLRRSLLSVPPSVFTPCSQSSTRPVLHTPIFSIGLSTPLVHVSSLAIVVLALIDPLDLPCCVHFGYPLISLTNQLGSSRSNTSAKLVFSNSFRPLSKSVVSDLASF